MMNFNWNAEEIPCKDLLKIFLSFQDGIKLSDLYLLNRDDKYKIEK